MRVGGEGGLAAVLIELNCPEHGLERFKIKVIKKYNIDRDIIALKFRTRPRHELQGIVVGKNVQQEELKECLMQYFRDTGIMKNVLSIRFQV
jgi:hypothetical protein